MVNLTEVQTLGNIGDPSSLEIIGDGRMGGGRFKRMSASHGR